MGIFRRRKEAKKSASPGEAAAAEAAGLRVTTQPKRASLEPDVSEAFPPEPEAGQAILKPEQVFPRPESPRVLVVANQKGGVGKTTSAVNIATALALGNQRVVLIDIDPQGNATTAMSVEQTHGIPGTYEVLLAGDPIEKHLVQSPHSDALWVLPASIELASAELELVNVAGRERKLSDALQRYLAKHEIDYVLIDCPPSLGLLTLNALVAATEIMVPIQAEYYALEGLTQLLRTINKVKSGLNDKLELSTVLVTMYDGRNNLAREVAAEVDNHFPKQTLKTRIPRSVRVAEAPSYGQSVITFQPNSPGAYAYIRAAAEIALNGVSEEK